MNTVEMVAGYIVSLSTIVVAISKIMDVKLKGLYDSQRLQYRYEICNFAGDLRNKMIKTREEFQAIFEMYDKYEALINQLKQTNHYIDNEISYITEQYKLLK